MRARAKELAEKREAERLKIVEEKEEQRWRGECEGKSLQNCKWAKLKVRSEASRQISKFEIFLYQKIL